MAISGSNALHDEDECDDHIALFARVLTSINVEALPAVALAARKREPGLANTTFGCKVLSPPLFGAYNILFPLEFADGCRWILKVPSAGYLGCYDDIAARALTAEALTMQMLKRETSIPLPKVHLFDPSMENELNCPFILMDYIEGVPLSELWYNHTSTIATDISVEQFRVVILMDLAEAMVQLRKYQFDKGGSPLFDEEGILLGVGPAKVADLPAMLGRIPNGDPDQSVIFYEAGPWTDPQQFFFDMLSRHQPSRYKFDKGIRKLLRLFIDWIPYDDHLIEDKNFVIAHPDYSLQNVMVSQEGRLCGLVDWDGVTAVPHCVGCEQYPNWLITDWDPARYTYDITRPNCMDDSPEELENCRKMYRRSIEAASQISCDGFRKLREDDDQRYNPNPSSGLRTTGIYLLAAILSTAAKDSMSIDDIISSLFDRITQITDRDRNVIAPNTEQQEPFIAREEDAHGRSAATTEKTGESLENITETNTLDPRSGQFKEASDDLSASGSIHNSLPSVCTATNTEGIPRFGLIQRALHYAIELCHKKDASQGNPGSNSGIFPSYRKGPSTAEDSQTLTGLHPAGPSHEPATFSADTIDTPIVDERYGQEFTLWDVVHAFADDVLDDVRMRRLRQGFDAIVASLLEREEFEGFHDLVD